MFRRVHNALLVHHPEMVPAMEAKSRFQLIPGPNLQQLHLRCQCDRPRDLYVLDPLFPVDLLPLPMLLPLFHLGRLNNNYQCQPICLELILPVYEHGHLRMQVCDLPHRLYDSQLSPVRPLMFLLHVLEGVR